MIINKLYEIIQNILTKLFNALYYDILYYIYYLENLYYKRVPYRVMTSD